MTTPLRIPAGLNRLRATEEGRAWLARLPGLVAAARDRWDLDLGEPFSAGTAAWTALARRRGELAWDLVLKISFPHAEAAAEAEALLHWHGRGAPRLIDLAPADWALLMAAISPGTPLSASLWPQQVALRAGGRVLAELHAVPLPAQHSFPALADVVGGWRELVRERARRHQWAQPDPELITEWLDLLPQLLSTAPAPVLLHGDANPGNMLAGEEEHRVRWFAIDPKPVAGDPAFDPWPLLEQIGDPFGRGAAEGGANAGNGPAAELADRTQILAPLLGTTAWRIAAWGLIRSVESTLWLADITPVAERAAALPELRQSWAQADAWRGAMARYAR